MGLSAVASSTLVDAKVNLVMETIVNARSYLLTYFPTGFPF